MIVYSASRWHGAPLHKKIAQRYLTKVALRRVTEIEEITWQAFMESDFQASLNYKLNGKRQRAW